MKTLKLLRLGAGERLERLLCRALAGVPAEAAALMDAECGLDGSRILFALHIDEYGAEESLHTLLRSLRRSPGALRGSVCGRMLSLGITSFLSQISLVAAMAAINNMLRKYGALDPVFGQEQYAQIPMAVVGIVMKFFQIVISVVVGMAAGCIPVVGYNMGAQQPQRVRQLLTKLLLAETAVGAVGFVFVEFLPRQLIAIFGAANESTYYTDFAIHAFRTYLCMIVLACVNKATFIFLQSMGKAAASTMLSMMREVVFGVGLALLLPCFFGLDGVLYSMPLSDILTFLIAIVLLIRTYRQLRQCTPHTEI